MTSTKDWADYQRRTTGPVEVKLGELDTTSGSLEAAVELTDEAITACEAAGSDQPARRDSESPGGDHGGP